VIALGTNDVGKGAAGTSGYPWLIGAMRASLGTLTVPAVWVEVRTLRGGTVPYPEWEDAWNVAIGAGGFESADWAGFIDSADEPRLFITGDDVHLTPAGADARASLILAALLSP
jgi:lysophospholipase L1-like esterase